MPKKVPLPARSARLASVGLLLWALGCAGAAPGELRERWEDALLEARPLSAEERTEQAASILRAERWQRVQVVHSRFMETVWRLWQNGSPLRILRGGRRVLHSAWKVHRRGPAEDSALEWLQPLHAESSDHPDYARLYARLLGREREALAGGHTAAARSELRAGHLDVAHFLLKRSLELEPDSRATRKVLAELAEQEALRPDDPELALHDWEVPLAEALLAGDYAAALQMGEPGPESAFAHAAAQLLAGDRDGARESFLALEHRGDAIGELAGQWLERPEVDLEGALHRATRHYRIKRSLGWIGGNALAEGGAALSSRSFGAWKNSLTPMNLAISLPARILRGWQPSGREVQDAAVQYLDQKPHGPEAPTARAWLDRVGWPKVEETSLQGPDLLLRAVQVPHERIGVPPLIVSRRAIHSEFVSASPALGSALEGRSAVWLRARRTREIDIETVGFALAPAAAERLIDELAWAVESGNFRATLASREAALERLQRIDRAVREGWTLCAEPWFPTESGLWSALAATVFDGREHTGAVALERGEDDIVAARTLGDEVRECPPGVLCLDRDGGLRTTLFAYADVESGTGFGFQSAAGHTGLSLSLNESGPEAALFLPFGRWLGIDRWLPIEAEFSFSPDAFYVGPVLRKRRCSEERPSGGSARELLPFGVRSRCSIRLY